MKPHAYWLKTFQSQVNNYWLRQSHSQNPTQKPHYHTILFFVNLDGDDGNAKQDFRNQSDLLYRLQSVLTDSSVKMFKFTS